MGNWKWEIEFFYINVLRHKSRDHPKHSLICLRMSNFVCGKFLVPSRIKTTLLRLETVLSLGGVCTGYKPCLNMSQAMSQAMPHAMYFIFLLNFGSVRLCFFLDLYVWRHYICWTRVITLTQSESDFLNITWYPQCAQTHKNVCSQAMVVYERCLIIQWHFVSQGTSSATPRRAIFFGKSASDVTEAYVGVVTRNIYRINYDPIMRLG